MAASFQPFREADATCPLGTVPINVLLIGTTGSGKSSTGNSILIDRKEFKRGNDCNSCTSEVKVAWKDYKATDGTTYRLKVIDGPGFRDSRIPRREADQRRTYKNIATVLKESEPGLNAFVFVVSVGLRFTNDDNDAYEFLKQVLGRDFMRKYGVVVAAKIDQLNNDDDDDDDTFEQWCARQVKYIRDLFKDSEHRIIPFDNVTRDESKQKAQLETLLEKIHQIKQKNGGITYKTELFAKFAKQYKSAMQKQGYVVIKEDFRAKLSILRRSIRDIKTGEHLQEAIAALETLLQDVQFEIEHCVNINKMKRHLTILKSHLDRMKDHEVGTAEFKSLMKEANDKIEDVVERASYETNEGIFSFFKRFFSKSYWESYF